MRGEFAVDLTDPARGIRLVANDPYGNRRLTLREGADGWLVDDEIAELRAGPVEASAIDPTRLAEYFGYGEISSGESFLGGVRELLPGEMRVAGPAGHATRWLPGPELSRRATRVSWEESVEELAGILERAVGRCIDDVDRCAVWLSGGLDSSPIAALAARAGRRVDGLCWTFPGAVRPDLPFAEAVGRMHGFPVHAIASDDAVSFADPGAWPVHPSTPEQTAFRELHERSYRRAAELGHRVVLTGFCGDSLYVGARRWLPSLLVAEGLGRAIDALRAIAAEVGWKRAFRTHVLGPLRPRSRKPARFPAPYLTPEARERILAAPRWPRDLDSARRPRQAERVLALLDSHGAEVERWYAARHGLEVRWPLRDPEVVDFFLAADDHLLDQGAETRPILRAAGRGLLPEEVRLRRGKGHFGALVERALEPSRLGWARPLALSPDALWRGVVREAHVARWLERGPEDDWDRLGLLQVLFGEIWRARRNGIPTRTE